jgi:very-short-patch-repair endonuclease
MSKEIQIKTGLTLKSHYDCDVVIDETQEPHCLFNLQDIGKLLKITNIHGCTKYYDKVYLKRNTNGGKQTKSFISYNILCKLLVKSRKPAVIDICRTINFDINSKVYTCVEADTIKCITEAFNGEQMTAQYRIGKYMVDLYFPTHNIIIECDESQHKVEVINDIKRENVIKELCHDCVFIRYDPYSIEFNIFKTINCIYNTIKSRNIS